MRSAETEDVALEDFGATLSTILAHYWVLTGRGVKMAAAATIKLVPSSQARTTGLYP